MKKRIVTLVTLSMCLAITACAGNGQPQKEAQGNTEQSEESAPAEEGTYVFKYAYSGAADLNSSLEHVVGTYLEEQLEERTEGRISVELYPGGAMGDAEGCLEQVELGTLQGCPAADSKLSTRFPAVQVIAMPYLFDSTETANAVLDGEFCKKMYQAIEEETAYTVLGVGVNGFRYLTNSKREIRTPEDMGGLKFRVMDSEIMIEMMSNLGAIGVPMAYSELYTAMQTNAIDGQENPATVIWRDYFDEVQGYMTCDGHNYNANFILVNSDWFYALPEDLQTIMREICVEAGNLERKTYDEWVDKAIDEMVERTGLQVYYPTNEELALFREATQEPAKEWLYKNVDAEWVDGIINAVDEVHQP